MKNSDVIVSNENIRKAVRRLQVVARDESVLQIAAGMDSQNKPALTAASISSDESVQLILYVSTEKNPEEEKDFGVSVRGVDFCSMTDSILGVDNQGPVSFSPKGNSIFIKNSASSIKIDLVNRQLKVASMNQEHIKFIGIVGREDLLRLVKKAGKYGKAADKVELQNVVWHVNSSEQPANPDDKSLFLGDLTVTSCSNAAIGHGKIPTVLMKMGKWDDAVKAYAEQHKEEGTGFDFAVASSCIDYIANILTLTDMEKIQLCVDDKYLHVLFDDSAMLSVRLASKFCDLGAIKQLFSAKAESQIVVDMKYFMLATGILNKKRMLNSKLGEHVAIRLISKADSGKQKEGKRSLVLKIAENSVEIPIIESTDSPDIDIFFSPALLNEGFSSQNPGNVIINVLGDKILLANGGIESGYTKDATKVLLASIKHAEGEKMEARFASGIVEEEDESKDKSKKKAKDKEG
mgnify:CR=1 FL=1